MNGVEMMMKAFGINPDDLRKQIEEPITQMLSGVQDVARRLGAIETRLARIEKHLGITETLTIEATAIERKVA